MNEEQIAKAREAKSAEELLALAKENGMELTKEEAADLYKQLHSSTELTDEELENVAGGGCGNSTVKIDGVSHLKVSNCCPCINGKYEFNGAKDEGHYVDDRHCEHCTHYVAKDHWEGYCSLPF